MVDIRKKTEREIQLEDQLRSTLSALHDLSTGHSIEEMQLSISLMMEKAREIGVELEKDDGI